jgi:hypothetical protein
MRVPKVNSKNIEEVKDETVKINFFIKPSMKDDSWKEDEKSLDKLIKKVEKFVRSSYEYREYITFLKEEMDMNQCAFFPKLAREDVSIEIHHSPLTLYDITSIIFNYVQIHEVEPTVFDVADEVMKAHFEGLIGLIPLTLTAHELVHNSDIFVPVDKVYGNVRGFYDRYRDGFTTDHKQLLKENIQVTKQLNNENYSPSVLERKFTYLEVEGIEFPSKIKVDEVATA